MKLLRGLYLLLLPAVVLSGCVSGGSTPTATLITPVPASATPTMTTTRTEKPSPSPTALPPRSTPTRTPYPTKTASLTPSPTLTPPPTLEPEQAEQVMREMLREPAYCPTPCFWGIIPGQTTLGEAQNIFTRLGLHLEFTNSRANKKFYAVIHDFDSGLSITPVLTIQDGIVKNLTIGIQPEKSRAGVPREWLAYSPETLIKRYGTPSKVDFWRSRRAPLVYAMDLHFEPIELIIEYLGRDITYKSETGSFRVCPLTAGFDSVQVWLGKDPEYPPSAGILLEEATSMRLEEFAELMTGDPKNACLELKIE